MKVSCLKRWPATGLVACVLLVFGSRPTLAQSFDANGFITEWLLFGPMSQFAGAAPGLDLIRLDYLSDGEEFFEATILPEVDQEIEPDYFGASAADGPHPLIPLDEVLVVREASTLDSGGPELIDFNAIYGAGAVVDNAVCYGWVYVNNETEAPIDAFIGLGSDDSIQVKLDDCEVFVLNQSRGSGAANEIQNTAPVTIPEGMHRLMVKVFNGGGGYNFRLRFQDADGNPITDETLDGFSVGREPGDMEAPAAIGLAISHSVDIARLVGLDKEPTLTVTAQKTFEDLADDTVVTIRETLGEELVVVEGSATPAPTSVEGNTLTWEIQAGDLIADGITLKFKFERPGDGCVTGEFQTGGGCVSPIAGDACIIAVALNAIFLGDITGGGDGTGTKPDEIGGVRLDMDQFLLTDELFTLNGNTTDADAEPFQVTEADFHPDFPDLDLGTAESMIDGTFFVNQGGPIQINSEGVGFEFPPGEDHGNSWNHILSNVTHDIDKGVGNLVVQGKAESYATGVGVHAAAGVTYDLDAIRETHGAGNVVNLLGVVGIDGCAGNIQNWIIFSDSEEVFPEFFNEIANHQTPPVDLAIPIPEEALYMTLATTDNQNGVGCDHGVFAELRITGELPEAIIVLDPDTAAAGEEITFDGSESTAPGDAQVTSYTWDFGDGETAEGMTVTHTYTARGTYDVTLTIETDDFQSASASQQVTVTFPCGDVSPLTSVDVGEPRAEGCAAPDGDCLVVFGGGREILSRSDEFQFTYQEVTGNVSATVRVDAITIDGSSARVGIMLRETLDADSAFAFTYLAPSTLGSPRANISARLEAGATVSSRGNKSLALPDAYLRLERIGAEFIGSYSSDGVTFEELDRFTLAAPPATMLIGLAVTARDTQRLGLGAEARFCDIDFGGEPPAQEICDNEVDDDDDGDIDCADADCADSEPCNVVGGRRVPGDCNADGSVNISDPVCLLGFLFQGNPTELPCGTGAQDDPGNVTLMDGNGDSAVNLSDAIFFLTFLFNGGPAHPLAVEGSEQTGCVAIEGCTDVCNE